jgi:hypothetical protein
MFLLPVTYSRTVEMRWGDRHPVEDDNQPALERDGWQICSVWRGSLKIAR